MPRTLILLRHAKSDWRAGASDDHERPLNARGQRAAAVVGVYLNQQGLAPDLVLSSTAIRARETCDWVLRHGGFAIVPRVERTLYLADPARILDAVRRAGADHRCILLVAHNPGLQDLAAGLAARGGTVGTAMAEGFATAALAICTCAVPWAEASLDRLELTEVVLAKSLL
ncbi:MAG: histidine phosphatase family protein [Alphaproteobacteria bacterium]